MNQAKKYIYNFLVDILDKYDIFIKSEINTIKFWEKIFDENPFFKESVEKYLKKINLLEKENANEDIIYAFVYKYYNDYYNLLNFDDKRKESLYYEMLKFINNNEDYLDSLLLDDEKEKIVKNYIKGTGYVIGYGFRGGFIFKDGSILDIKDDDHSIISFDYVCKNGIITYRISEGDLYIRIIKDNYSYKQKKEIEDMIKQFDFDYIHYEIYDEGGKMLKQKSINIYNYHKIFENKGNKKNM